VKQLTRVTARTVRSIPTENGLNDLRQGRTAMLAEIFLVRLQMLLRVVASNSATAISDKRFVPIRLPRESQQA
jgi:hypothetical protein